MKKNLFLFLIILFSTLHAYSQTTYGIKAGFNFSSLKGDGQSNFSTLIMPNFGSFAKIKLNQNLVVQPEVMFSFEGAKASGLEGLNAKYNVNYLNFPILLNYNAGSGFNLLTGPQIGILLSSKAVLNSTLAVASIGGYQDQISSNSISSQQYQTNATSSTQQTVDLSGKIKSMNFSWVLGASYNIEKTPFSVDLRYNLGLSNIDTQAGSSNHINVFQLGVGYAFKK
jgi:hypothetical protein